MIGYFSSLRSFYTDCSKLFAAHKVIFCRVRRAPKKRDGKVSLFVQSPQTDSDLSKRKARRLPKREYDGLLSFCLFFADQYIPPMPPPAGAGGSGAGMSVTTLSVVSRVAATEAAFCNTLRETLVGSMMPLSTMSV